MFAQTLSRVSLFAGVLALVLGVTGPNPAIGAEPVYVVQLASVKSEARAKGAWKRMQQRHAELLGDLNLMLQRFDGGEQGVFYRMQTGPFPSRMTAVDMCDQIKAAGLDCLVRQR